MKLCKKQNFLKVKSLNLTQKNNVQLKALMYLIVYTYYIPLLIGLL